MISISLCMIVKNEEPVLARCLDSIYDLMDEIIIVDTGSSDCTKEIASRYTDKIYDFTWIHDFSAARNYSFSKATMDYIYVADADEVLDEENRERFLQLKENMVSDIEIVQMIYANQLEHNTTYNFDEEYRPKLFKRLREFVWTDPIHEGVRLEPVIYDSDIVILHKPTSNHGKRDFTIFQRVIDSGKSLSQKLHSMYARELFITGNDQDFLASESFFKDSSIDPSRSVEEVKEAMCVLARVARLKQDIHQLLSCVAKAMAVDAPSELCYELGEYYQSCGEYSDAIIWYYNAAFETTSILNIHTSGDMPRIKLAECYELLGNEEESANYGRLAEEWVAERG